jgi:hypothetical protein
MVKWYQWVVGVLRGGDPKGMGLQYSRLQWCEDDNIQGGDEERKAEGTAYRLWWSAGVPGGGEAEGTGCRQRQALRGNGKANQAGGVKLKHITSGNTLATRVA